MFQMSEFLVTRSLLVWAAVIWATMMLACATGSTIVTSPFVPDGTPRGKPEGGYDRVATSCMTTLSPEAVLVARVVRRGPGGQLIPVLGVTALLETHGTVHANPTAKPISIDQDGNGRFTYPLTLWSDTVVYYRGDLAVGWEEVEDTAILTLQALGCEPLRLQFTEPGEERTLELQCFGDS